MRKALPFCFLVCAALSAQMVPPPTDLPSQPFFIKQTWYIGGSGSWDSLTMDPSAGLLYIAHGSQVQVVGVSNGTVAGSVSGLREARSIALDDTGQVGYVSDGQSNEVKAFNRSDFEVVGAVHTGAPPSTLVYEPQSGLLFAICPNATIRGLGYRQAKNHRSSERKDVKESPTSVITVMGTQPLQRVAEILVDGTLGLAKADDRGHVYIAVQDHNTIAQVDASGLRAQLHTLLAGEGEAQALEHRRDKPVHVYAPVVLDWRHSASTASSAESLMRSFPIGPDCVDPQGMAVDSKDLRLFAACRNMKLIVLNTGTGEIVATLPTGPGVDAVGYDPERGLIFTANGGGDGSLTVISQQVPDLYAVIQNLPTRQRARALAVDPTSGSVYLVTDYMGVDMSRAGGIGDLRMTPVAGSFQVLKIGN